MNNLAQLYNMISEDTWNRLGFANKTNSKFSETTITENLLYNINKYKIEHADSSIQMYEAKNEKTNGNDLEVYLEIESGLYIFLAIQAKRLYVKEQKYKAISHKVSGAYQIDLLLNYAKSKQGVGLYLLYNYAPYFKHKNKKKYGCSLVKADSIKDNFYSKGKGKWSIPKFLDLHIKYAIPLFLLAKSNCMKNHISSQYPALKKYKDNEIVGAGWLKVENLKINIEEEVSDTVYQVENNHSDIKKSDKEYKYIETFSPKYKIVINKKR